MDTPLISVIVPVYGVEKYLNKCVQSIVDQTFDNIEIILVDDGSKDGCSKICDEWAANDGRIKVIHKENQGISAARNDGLAVANGEYITFVDADDYIHPKLVEISYKCLKETEADVLAYHSFPFEDGKEEECCELEYGYEIEFDSNTPLETTIFPGQFPAGAGYVWNKLWSRKAIEGVKFPLGNIIEDRCFVVDVYLKRIHVVGIDKQLYYYRQREDSFLHKNLYKVDEAFANMLDYIFPKIMDQTENNIGMELLYADLNFMTRLSLMKGHSERILRDSFESYYDKYVVTHRLHGKWKRLFLARYFYFLYKPLIGVFGKK